MIIAGDATRPPRAAFACALAFLDPPYRSGLAAPALTALAAAGWLAARGAGRGRDRRIGGMCAAFRVRADSTSAFTVRRGSSFCAASPALAGERR